MHDQQHSDMMQQITGQVRSMFYLVDEPATTLTIQAEGEAITVRAFGQLALDLRELPRGATICATIHDTSPDCLEIIGFSVIGSCAGISSS